jgi:small subunit ribosomal protein S27Ae
MSHYELYDDDGSPNHETCPRCGDSYLGDYGDRLHCGRCSYTEWK